MSRPVAPTPLTPLKRLKQKWKESLRNDHDILRRSPAWHEARGKEGTAHDENP